MFLSLVLWIGGLVFFAIMAPTVFHTLPTRLMAGTLVGTLLGKMHWIAIFSGIVFLISSLLYSRLAEGDVQVLAGRHILICLMLGLTLISQFWIMPRMLTLRAQVTNFDTDATLHQPARVQFDALHKWSERMEQAVLLMGLVVIYLTAAA
jgi:hypothetical protein